jgi:nickel-dependent lactate racemase
MIIYKNNIINELDEKDKNKLFFFAEMLFKHSKYEKLRDEIGQRRKEVKEKNIISHKDFWQDQ